MKDSSEIQFFDRIIQTEVDQTAPVVYEAAKRATESENGVYRASLIHDEDLHVNVGRTQRWIPEVDEDLQFRRPGGGSYIIHDNGNTGTYCNIDSRVKNRPKEMTGLQRRRMAYQALEALDEIYENVGVIDGSSYVTDFEGETVPHDEEAVYYVPQEGDIYLKQSMMPRYDDPQIAGIGLAEIEVDDEWVQIGRVCMYPAVSGEAEEFDIQIRETQDLDEERPLSERVEPVRNLDAVANHLESGDKRRIKADKLLSDESRERGRELQEIDGSRTTDPCF